GRGVKGIEVTGYTQREPYFKAKVRHLQDTYEPSKDVEAMQVHMVNQFAKFVSMIPYLPDELQVVVMNIKDPGKASDLIASNLNISLEEKQDLLSTLEVQGRLEKLSAILNREIELLELGHKIQSQVQSELNKNQKEFYLRQQMKAIQKELGEGDGKTAEIEELRRRIEEANMPPEARKAADHELERLRLIPPESAEHTVVRTYLEWLVSLPWTVSPDADLDLHHARRVRAAGTHHPEHPQRQLEQPALHAGRDRQARHGLPRRPGVGAARGARSRAEQHLHGPLPRRSLRPFEGDVRHHGERARHDPTSAA